MKDRPVWFDFDNTPHVLFLEPLIRGLREAGATCVVTARRHAQTVELAANRGIRVTTIGAGDRPGRARKIAGVLTRAARLVAWARNRRPALLVSSSRSGSLAARIAGIPSVGLLDYEHAEQRVLAFGCQVIWLPDLLRDVRLAAPTRRVARFYPGLKENLYLDAWRPDPRGTRRTLAVPDTATLVVARPPADMAHYAADRSLDLWVRVLRALALREDAVVVITARTAGQRARLERLVGGAGVRFLTGVVDGPDLVASADLVIGGGGTMNREAAVLGVPVWSVFCGPPPAIDEQLAREGRLHWVRTDEQAVAALEGPLPPRLPPRGPVPEGLARILTDVRSRWGG